mgnify:CR=1 FL=1
MDLPYQPFWCEENAWHLCQDPRVRGRRYALIVTGDDNVALWAQRAGPPGQAVAWDYHVLVLAEAEGAWTAWDPDCVHGPTLPAGQWLAGSFPCPERVPAALQPRFRLVDGDEWVAHLRSDRSHMRDARGGWQRPPPPWPPPGDGGMNLREWLAPRGGRGRLFDLAGLRRLVSGGGDFQG